MPSGPARILTAAGATGTAASAFLAWTWTSGFPGDLTVYGYPGGLQWLTLAGALITLLLTLASYHLPGLRWTSPSGGNNGILYAALGAAATTWFTLIAISAELGGLANLEPGGWAAGATSLITLLGALGLPLDRHPRGAGQGITRYLGLRLAKVERPLPPVRELPSPIEVLLIVVAFATGLYAITFGLDTDYGELFTAYLLLAGFTVAALTKSGLVTRLRALAVKHRTVTTGAAFAAAAAFPFTQSSDQYTSVATNILIFATVALGLNIVVGLAGLLDLGYVAFLGVGAYAAALVSGSPASPIHVHFPFWAAMLTGAAVSIVFGVLIGAPTLRLRGDYLAIVTLGFGEIFRITMNNLNGTTGPKVTNGANGIPRIPDLVSPGFTIRGLHIPAFDFGRKHSIGGLELGRFSNYYLLMLLVTAFVVLVFARVGNSRIGRAWIAIREDETAAEAMGINGFRLKLLAFALGACMAGLAGTVQAHVSYTVTPDQYTFAEALPPNSAFLLAAVILGGMGTISGPLVGATLLFLIPKKLEFLSDYQLLAFGLALIVLMRVRPEGLIPNRRRQLEFHEADIPDQAASPETALTKAGA
ncbi:branched-chain amino acid ABC transporter permease [Kitasatospora sp. GP82]|uniref:branched-chain amino acid ABC transporter permease n=1 Tax=Kitasatospora sp. GP82 TaxID=3035089 RepID=UPI00247543A7|nr:branched-chain amino acid ABC transporter permease [Kitasatospora sp. GP82]